MCFQAIIVLIVSIPFIGATNVARVVFQIKMNSELVIIKEITFAKPTIWMDKNDVSVFINIASFQMPV